MPLHCPCFQPHLSRSPEASIFKSSCVFFEDKISYIKIIHLYCKILASQFWSSYTDSPLLEDENLPHDCVTAFIAEPGSVLWLYFLSGFMANLIPTLGFTTYFSTSYIISCVLITNLQTLITRVSPFNTCLPLIRGNTVSTSSSQRHLSCTCCPFASVSEATPFLGISFASLLCFHLFF